MKTFVDWAKENQMELPVFDAAPSEPADVPQGEESTEEQRARTGWSANYPPAYFSAQYPKKWMAPRKATHDLDAEQMGRKDK